RDLANRLHRHQLGALKFSQGAAPTEIADVMRTLSADSRSEPLGTQPLEQLQRWPHVRLFPQAYDQLELSEDGSPRLGHLSSSTSLAGRLWLGLASAALMRESGEDLPQDPKEIARAINGRRRDATYDQVIVNYLMQLSQELRMSHGAEAAELKDRLGSLLGELDQQTLSHLLALGGNLAQRRQLIGDAVQSMPIQAVLTLLKATAASSKQTISNSMVRLLTKLALHAEQGSQQIRQDADLALRDTIRELVSNWTLDDPNPGTYTKVLERLTRPVPTGTPSTGATQFEARRIVEMSLEIGTMGASVKRAVDQMLEEGHAMELLQLLDGPQAPPDLVDDIWAYLATPQSIRQLLMNEPRDTEVVERLVARMGLDAAEPLLDALEIADSRTSRRRLLTRLGKLGTDIGQSVADRLPGSPWFVQRNLLALMGSMPSWPRSFSPTTYAANTDPRVRREALKLMLRLPDYRDEAIGATFADDDEQVIRLGLTAAAEGCPAPAVPRLMTMLRAHAHDIELRALGIRVLGTVRTPATRDWLVDHALTRKKLFRGRRLMPKSPEILAIVAALARGWREDKAAAEVLRLAQSSGDAEIRAVAQLGREPA
ncbi:MAG TPA: hypothetical protein VLB12_07415, partial [Gemmatimonadales bacterium]|nr:hypothetical protein [Gemmatimonadales bacterium]